MLLLLLAAVVTFVILMPLFILLRADDTDGWPWPIALIPLWLADALYGAALVWRLITALRVRSEGGGAHPVFGLQPTLLAIAVYTCVIGAQARAPPAASRRLPPPPAVTRRHPPPPAGRGIPCCPRARTCRAHAPNA